MAFVCESLTNTETSQTCTKWIVLEQSNSILPELSAADRDSMALWFIGIFAAVFTIRMIRKLFGI